MEKRAVAELLGKAADDPGQLDKANIRVESIIRKERELEAHGVIQLMCDLLHERADLIKESKADDCPLDLRESTDTIIWSASRSHIKELKTVVEQLRAKFGDEFISIAKRNNREKGACVNAKVCARLSIAPPSPAVKREYLRSIAALHKVPVDLDELLPPEGSAGLMGDSAEAEAGTGGRGPGPATGGAGRGGTVVIPTLPG